ncbi:MAG: glycosyltransferase [Actinobacteria bacterium]|nr:glycosyltransferase [Actinomycetota bacterium]
MHPTGPTEVGIDVAVNLLWCLPGRVGGSEEYLVRQMIGLSEIESPYSPVLYVLPGFAAAHPELASRFRLVVAPIDGTNRARRVLAEHGWLAEQTRASALVHHGGGTVPARGKRPTVLTIHDLQYLAYPQYFSRSKRAYLQWAMPRSARRADVIAVPTEFVRRTVIEAYNISFDRVLVVPHGIEPGLGIEATDEEVLRRRFGLGDGPVIVLPAVTHPHKGHLFLLDLLASHWTDPSLRLVLTGGRGAADDAVAAAIDRLGLGDRVVRAGRVSAADRDGLISLATAMVFPSEYEGFGAPIIEAMALGTPVICSDRACVPEVAGGAALVLPLRADAWAGALDVLTLRRDELVRAGRVRAAAFTTAASAQALVSAYDLALS